MITVIYSYETINGEQCLFAQKKIKSPRGSNRTNEYKALRELLHTENVKYICSTFCYHEADYNHEMLFLKKGEHCFQ